jgi:peptidyl-Asp metalloendopeptidase
MRLPLTITCPVCEYVRLAALVFCFCVGAGPLSALAADLFASPQGATQVLPVLDISIPSASVRRERAASLEFSELLQSSLYKNHNAFVVHTLTANLFADQRWQLRERQRVSYQNGVTSWHGSVVGDDPSIANLVWDEQGNAVGFFYLGDVVIIFLEGRLIQLDPTQFPDDKIVSSSALSAKAETLKTDHTLHDEIPVVIEFHQPITPIRRLWAQLAIDLNNAVWANSGLQIKARLEDVRQGTAGTSGHDDQGRFVVAMDDAQTACLAGYQHRIESPMIAGFSRAVTQTLCGVADFGVARGLGYAFGLGNDQHGDAAQGAKAVAVGDPIRWRTFMANRAACGDGAYCPRLPQLSSPDLFYRGFALGHAQANNVRALETSYQHWRSNHLKNNEMLRVARAQHWQWVATAAPAADDISAEHVLGKARAWYEQPDDLQWDKLQNIALTLPGGLTVTARRVDGLTKTSPAEEIRWAGLIKGASPGMINLVQHGGSLHGVVHVAGRTFRLATSNRRKMWLEEIDTTQLPQDHPEGVPTAVADVMRERDSGEIKLHKSDLMAAAEVVDVLVMYTPQAEKSLTDIRAEINLAIENANLIYAEAGLLLKIRLAGIEKVQYNETNNFNTDLIRLKKKGDKMLDEAHTLRDRYGADVVSLWVASDSYCGFGYMMTQVSTTFADWAFNVISTSCAVNNFSFVHELGHNMGLNHDVYVAPGPGVFDDSHGYVNLDVGWRTIMAYSNLCSDRSKVCPRIPYFSSREQTYLGDSLGDARADEARTLASTAQTVAAFRSAPAAQPGSVEIVGNWNGWSSGYAMELQDDLRWGADISLNRGKHEYAVVVNRDWNKLLGQRDALPYVPQNGMSGIGKGNISLWVPQTGQYRFIFDALTQAYEVQRFRARNEDWRRTVVMLYAKPKSGQKLFLRGGFAGCQQAAVGNAQLPCSVPIEYPQPMLDRNILGVRGDYFLDWGGLQQQDAGHEPSQVREAAGSPLVWTTNNAKHKKTLEKDLTGYTPLNQYGSDYWLLDVYMDCRAASNGWFEVRGFMTGKKGGWEPEIKDSKNLVQNVPYATKTHWAQCGKLNVFKWGQGTAVYGAL